MKNSCKFKGILRYILFKFTPLEVYYNSYFYGRIMSAGAWEGPYIKAIVHAYHD
jgi:hypothetical protein